MGALPKRKPSKASSLKRRAKDKLKNIQLSLEKTGKSPTMPHRVSKTTGIYKGKKILKVK
jgi:ribosomal protein L32